MSNHQYVSLETLCLDTIVDNFDKFCAAFLSKENTNFQLYLEFIQRHCCHKILQKLADRKLIKDAHLPIVINKYTKELDFHNIISCNFDAILSSLKEFGNVIQRFYMINIGPFYSYDNMWQWLSNVQSINLQQTNCSDEAVILISNHCPHIKSLNLYYCCKVSDKGLLQLCLKRPPLELINLKRTAVTFRGVAAVLKNIPTLQKLYFEDVPRAIFEALGLNDPVQQITEKRLFNLTNIVILNKPMRPESHLTSNLEVCQEVCPFIEDLAVTEIVSAQQLDLCTLFVELKIVNLQGSLSPRQILCIDDFLKIRGEQIHSLSLMAFSMSLEVLKNSCPNLKHLTLEYPSFTVIPIDNPDLKFLHLEVFNLHNGVLDSEENIKSIGSIVLSSPNLEELNFRLCQYLNEIYDIILNYPKKLKILSFSNTSVLATFLMEVLKIHTDLETLCIANSGITTEEYDDIMDIVDRMEKKVAVDWADYRAAISELYDTDIHFLPYAKRQIMKL